MNWRLFLGGIAAIVVVIIAALVFLLVSNREEVKTLAPEEKSEFLNALNERNPDKYRSYLDNGKKLSFVFEDGDTPLEKLIYINDFNSALKIIETGFNLKAIPNHNPIETINQIVGYNYRGIPQVDEITLLLVEQVKDQIESTADNGNPLLFTAIQTRNDTVILKCLTYTKNINRQYRGMTTLHYAILYRNDLSIIKAIVEKGANVNLLDADGDSPLMLAIAHDYRVIEYLVTETNADLNLQNTDGDTLLHLAVRQGNVEVVSLLLNQKSINLNLRNREGLTAKELVTQLASKDSSYQRILTQFPK